MGVRRSRIRAWAFGMLAFLALAIGAYALVMYGTPGRLHKMTFVTGKGSLPDLWYNILWAHAISAGVALAVGWLQFIKRLRQHAPNIHRLIGYILGCKLVRANPFELFAKKQKGAVTGTHRTY